MNSKSLSTAVIRVYEGIRRMIVLRSHNDSPNQNEKCWCRIGIRESNHIVEFNDSLMAVADGAARSDVNRSVAVVIPAYRCSARILDVLERIDESVSRIVVVDDCCPEGTGAMVRRSVVDPRVRVIANDRNLGVGGATAVGFAEAFEAGADIIAKLDGDGQHMPELVANLARPIALGEADMVKGNRLSDPAVCLRQMPLARLVANMTLSLVSRPVTGYWDVADPANGYFAMHRNIVGRLPWPKIDSGYFFETDLLFWLGTLGARVAMVPMAPVYPGGGVSSVRIWREVVPFALKSVRNLTRRLARRPLLASRDSATVL